MTRVRIQSSKIPRTLWPLRRSPIQWNAAVSMKIDAQLDRTPQNFLRVLAIRRPTPDPLARQALAAAQFSVIRRLERQLHPQDLPPKTFVASSHVNYVAFINYHPSRRKSIPKEGPDRDDWKRASRD